VKKSELPRLKILKISVLLKFTNNGFFKKIFIPLIPNPNMDFDKVIKERHSARNYTSKKPDWRKIIEAIDAANKAPLAGNITTLKFILVSDKDKIKEIADASQQSFVGTANNIVVVCSDKKQAVLSYGKDGEKYALEQAGASIENFLLKITDLGLGSCWVGAFVESMVKETLSIPDNIEVIALFPVGYERGTPLRRRKTSLDNVLYFDKWDEKRMKPLTDPPISRT